LPLTNGNSQNNHGKAIENMEKHLKSHQDKTGQHTNIPNNKIRLRDVDNEEGRTNAE